MNYPSLTVRYDGETLIAEWDNREIPRSCVTTVFLAGFWVVWTPVTAGFTYMLISGDGPTLFLCIWLLFGYAGVILIPMTWLLRYTIERIEFDSKQYRHYFVNLSWWFPKQWDVDEITRISFGTYDDESIATLNVWGRKRDMIAYWATDDFREHLLETIQAHLGELGSTIPVVNTNSNAESA